MNPKFKARQHLREALDSMTRANAQLLIAASQEQSQQLDADAETAQAIASQINDLLNDLK